VSINWPTLKAALHAWMVAGSGLPAERVLWANQDNTKIKTPFASINHRLAVTRTGVYDEERLDPEAPGVIQRIGQRHVTVSCHLHGPGAVDLLERAQAHLDTHAARAIFDAAGLAVADRGRVDDLTALLDTQHEEQAHLDIILSLATITTEEVGYIDSAGIVLTAEAPDGAVVDQSTQTITSP
jgi:hypothetical protein